MTTEGNLTTDPGEIEKTWRVLPMGYWKGSGLSIALDLIATVLSDGNSVRIPSAPSATRWASPRS